MELSGDSVYLFIMPIKSQDIRAKNQDKKIKTISNTENIA